MEKINANSKLGQHFVKAYEASTWYTLKDVYVKPSAEKQAAFERCRQKCEAENGDGLKVISFNCNQFTVGFEVTTASGATELRVITRCYNYVIPLGSKL